MLAQAKGVGEELLGLEDRSACPLAIILRVPLLPIALAVTRLNSDTAAVAASLEGSSLEAWVVLGFSILSLPLFFPTSLDS